MAFKSGRLINLRSIELIVYDFDGVMTDNRVLVGQDGNESVLCNRSDGLAVQLFSKAGVKQLIISTETNHCVKQRAKKLRLKCLQGTKDKKNILAEYCKLNKIKPANVVFIGNDLNDFDVMKFVGYPVCPDDAAGEIKKISKIILKKQGGSGVIREFYSLVKL